ncbi:hypothetical protein WMY93_027316 [Mugilogobius chulae]|uniref:EMI domain-containing protein n=1 Tax=Mugilogobius chulae TaxID=88201 RepID=A0AAW0N2T3_9GOBI
MENLPATTVLMVLTGCLNDVEEWVKSREQITLTRNHCAYVVQKNITCIMQDGAIPFVKAEYTTKCIWGQKCPVLMYRTIYKPKYKVGYKTITELEWRCCPGYSGENCFDGPTSEPGAALPHRPGVKGFPMAPAPLWTTNLERATLNQAGHFQVCQIQDPYHQDNCQQALVEIHLAYLGDG